LLSSRNATIPRHQAHTACRKSARNAFWQFRWLAFRDDNNSLLVHVTIENMDAVDAKVQALSVPRPRLISKPGLWKFAKEYPIFLIAFKQSPTEFPAETAEECANE